MVSAPAPGCCRTCRRLTHEDGVVTTVSTEEVGSGSSTGLCSGEDHAVVTSATQDGGTRNKSTETNGVVACTGVDHRQQHRHVDGPRPAPIRMLSVPEVPLTTSVSAGAASNGDRNEVAGGREEIVTSAVGDL